MAQKVTKAPISHNPTVITFINISVIFCIFNQLISANQMAKLAMHTATIASQMMLPTIDL